MNRLTTLFLIGLAGLLASCGSSVTSSGTPKPNDEFSVAVTPDRLTLNTGDWTTISAVVELSNHNSAPTPVSPSSPIRFFSSDPRVSISPGGEVCAGQWDSRFLTCTPVLTTAGLPDLPAGFVTVTAYNAAHNVSGTTQVSVHQRAAGITLSSPQWGNSKCISQNKQVRYVASAVDAGGTAIQSCSTPAPGCVFDNDYTWSVADPNVAAVSSFGDVLALNPGVTTVFAKLNGTTSAPISFATCPPSSILLQSSPFTRGVPVAPFSTADLNLNKGDQKFMTATLLDNAGSVMPLNTLPLDFISSDRLTGTFSSLLPLTSKLTATTSGRTTVMAACEPPTCNAAVADFTIPSLSGPVTIAGKDAGFGFPIYSNVIGVTVVGNTGSTVLVTGPTFADGTTLAHRLDAYDSESLALTHSVVLANQPNSLVTAPDGGKAYLGSDAGLVVVDLTTFLSSIQTFPVAGGLNTDVVTGTVLGVSPDSRFVVVSDISRGLVFYIDTTGTKVAARYVIPAIKAVAFSPDSSNTWVAGDLGVYVFQADTFVPTKTSSGLSTGVTALAWTPDGQSYFAAGNQLVNYSTCDDGRLTPPQPPKVELLTGVPVNLAVTALDGVPRAIGLSTSGAEWLDYSVSTSAQVGANGKNLGSSNVCLSTVTVSGPLPTPSGISCTGQQISFSPRLEQAFVIGNSVCPAENVLHAYDVNLRSAFTLLTKDPASGNPYPIVPLSGGVLSDGRKLYVGTWDSTKKTAALHRFNLIDDPANGLVVDTEDVVTSTTTSTPPVTTVSVPASIELVPSFVAVVPK